MEGKSTIVLISNLVAIMDDIQSRHKKELKALDGEKRSAIKKAKVLKGKKGKDAVER